MAMTLDLTDIQVEALRKVIYPLCEESDVEAALRRYPGLLGPGDCFLSPYTLDTLTKSCIDKLSLENQYFSRSFMLRLIEQKWGAEMVRRGVTGALPILVRAPRGFEVQIEVLTSALAQLIGQIPEKPSEGDIGVVAVFRRFCETRESIQTVADSLQRFETLKSTHDALHMLQVLGAGWLDAFAAEGTKDSSAAPLLALLARVKAASAIDAADVASDVSASWTRCVMTCLDAERRIRTGDAGEIAFACAMLRSLLIRELPIIDAAMFSNSREFPLREFCSLFSSNKPGLEAARLAAVDLGDTLRRRLMEHALWQATDLRLYAIEQGLAQPANTLIQDLAKSLPWVTADLRVLLDSPVAKRAIAAMTEAVLRHAMATDGRPYEEPTAFPATLEGIRLAFAGLRSCARSAFLDVDQALRLDFARLLALKAPLQIILDRVPRHCAFLLPAP